MRGLERLTSFFVQSESELASTETGSMLEVRKLSMFGTAIGKSFYAHVNLTIVPTPPFASLTLLSAACGHDFACVYITWECASITKLQLGQCVASIFGLHDKSAHEAEFESVITTGLISPSPIPTCA